MKYCIKKSTDITEPIVIFRDLNNKPFVKYPNIYFNVSHSNNIVVCAIDNGQVGVDIEFHDPLLKDDLEKNSLIFSLSEKLYLNKYNCINTFYNLWCLKESFLKFTGEGIVGNNLSENEFLAKYNFNEYFFKYYDNKKIVSEIVPFLTDYSLAITHTTIEKIELVFVDYLELQAYF